MIKQDIYLYNSLTEKKEIFRPLNAPHVDIYVCGPTVYDYVHLGNMRPVVVFDTLRRFLESQNYSVKFVSNYTDVDDKIINRAISEQTDTKTISDRFIAIFEANLHAVNALVPTVTPRATAYVPKMIEFIGELVDKGFAYVKDGNVYFRVTKIKDYGKLANVNVSELIVGARIEENINKENPIDFILWKKSDDILNWNSPWSKGRPGWHTECVVMINEVFKKPKIDIHGGGFDLKFPHHENEIAQAEAHSDSLLANYWLHNGFVNLNDEKMAKSTGNIITAQDFLEEHDGNILRLILLSTHYRAPLNLKEDVINLAKTEILKIQRALISANLIVDFNQLVPQESPLFSKFINFLSDDLNTPNALSVIYEGVKELNIAVRNNDIDETSMLAFTIIKMLRILGLEKIVRVITDEDHKLYQEYNLARANKDFAKSDKIRDELIKRGLM
ncbi:MAG TPA: cysteine--tRNA ligase [Bacilli bacterium]|nr:cysteine--tRNA ligase [Bacilli bacterium]